VIDLGEPYGAAAMTSEEPAPSWPRLLIASEGLWLSGRLLPVAKRAGPPRMALAVLWVSDRCAGLARRMLPAG
jgi:hypothetical protein